MDTQGIEQPELKETTEDLSELVLHNDDYNTFDHVIECLINHCDHQPFQAEQCAYIVHYKGKCTVKNGPKSKLEPLLHLLKIENLTVELR